MTHVTKLDSASSMSLAERVDLSRLDASRKLPRAQRSELGQFLTPPKVASFMASLFESFPPHVRVLDAGAGVGSLLAALIIEACARPSPPRKIDLTAYELDASLVAYLRTTLADCRKECEQLHVSLESTILEGDFIQSAVEALDGGLFGARERPRFTHAILNPPYKKLSAQSAARMALRRVGIETSNLYAAFIALAILLLEPGGEIVAICPRSFCNGPYFRPFRELLLGTTVLRQIHVFESRTAAFDEDEVLQENIILHAVKGGAAMPVRISSSSGPDDELISLREVPFAEVVRPDDPERFIHLVPDQNGQRLAEAHGQLPATLADLGVMVSTGRVVDFRARDFLRAEPEAKTFPLIYPTHFSCGIIDWPKAGKKPNALVNAPETQDLFMPSGMYVLVKRFSSKEERRRVVAALFDPQLVQAPRIGFENHLNVFHASGGGLEPKLARGLAAFLNSSFVDAYFRQFNGHTQVNATDLRNLKYPSASVLKDLGVAASDPSLPQEALDHLVEQALHLGEDMNHIQAKQKSDEALSILKALGLPRQQQNERSALTLLALLGLKPSTPWSKASAPLMGITPIMDFIKEHYGKAYAPNTRETVRRQTVHQFLDAGLIVANPDEPTRPVNSPKAVYQIEVKALALLRKFGSSRWNQDLEKYLRAMGALALRYASAREMTRIPVKLPSGQTLKLSPGPHSELTKRIVEDFCSRFAPGGNVLYVGDTGDKFAIFDEHALQALGVQIDSHGKMPDVVIHRPDKNWLILVEAVTSHGPVNPKRRGELAKLFEGSDAGLVYVTAFLTRKAMIKYLGDISWETEVWVAEAPDHMIHFDGERFLGPY